MEIKERYKGERSDQDNCKKEGNKTDGYYIKEDSYYDEDKFKGNPLLNMRTQKRRHWEEVYLCD